LDKLESLLLFFPVLLLSMVAHEYAHGYAALKQGDATAYQQGRLTWNPVVHIDPFWTILLPALTAMGGGPMFGGAKPIPVTPRNYRNYKRGDIIVSLAGVAANFGLAVAATLIFALLGLIGRAAPGIEPTLALMQVVMTAGVHINFWLIGFNLLPIPPLDGSHVFKYLLPPVWAQRYQEYAHYGFFALIVLIYFGRPILDVWRLPWTIAAALLLGAVQKLSLAGMGQWQ